MKKKKKKKKKMFFKESKSNDFKHNLYHNIQTLDTCFDTETYTTTLTNFLEENSRNVFRKRIPVQK